MTGGLLIATCAMVEFRVCSRTIWLLIPLVLITAVRSSVVLDISTRFFFL